MMQYLATLWGDSLVCVAFVSIGCFFAIVAELWRILMMLVLGSLWVCDSGSKGGGRDESDEIGRTEGEGSVGDNIRADQVHSGLGCLSVF